METVKTAVKLIKKGAQMITIYLKDAYFHIPIHPLSRRYLRFAAKLKGKIRHYQLTCLPFGIASAPRIFTKVMAEAVASL